MRIFILTIFIMEMMFSYYLAVDNRADVLRMKKLNFLCDKEIEGYFVCMTSNNKNKLVKIKDFLSNIYNINTYVLDENNIKHKKFGLDGIGRDSIQENNHKNTYIENNDNVPQMEDNIGGDEGLVENQQDSGINDNELYEKNRKLLEKYKKAMANSNSYESMEASGMDSYSMSNDYTGDMNNYSMPEKMNNRENNYNKYGYSTSPKIEEKSYSIKSMKNYYAKYSHDNQIKSEEHVNSVDNNYDDIDLPDKVDLYKDIDNIKPKSYSKPSSTGYCIQVASSPKLKDVERDYRKFENYKLARIEKIGRYYVIRIGESDSVSGLRNLLSQIQMIRYDAYIRKCDFDLNRIIKINNDGSVNLNKTSSIDLGLDDIVSTSNSGGVADKCICPPSGDGEAMEVDPVKQMYDDLAKGKLNKAQKEAKNLIDTNPVDAYTVLGIVYMKKGDMKKSTYYFKKANEAKQNQDFLLEDNL